MDISEVAAETHTPVSTIRYYEQRGLIQSVGRIGLRRQFNDSVVQRIALIKLGAQAGFSLEELKSMLTSKGAQNDRRLLHRKAEALDAQIKNLTKLRDGLRRAAECEANSHFECATFLRIVNVAKKRGKRSSAKRFT